MTEHEKRAHECASDIFGLNLSFSLKGLGLPHDAYMVEIILRHFPEPLFESAMTLRAHKAEDTLSTYRSRIIGLEMEIDDLKKQIKEPKEKVCRWICSMKTPVAQTYCGHSDLIIYNTMAYFLLCPILSMKQFNNLFN